MKTRKQPFPPNNDDKNNDNNKRKRRVLDRCLIIVTVGSG